MKYAWLDGQRRSYSLPVLCETLDVSISGYRAWKRGGRRSHRRLTDAQLLELVRAIHAQFKGAYGSPRMVDELRGRGFPASKARVERLMRDNGIRARHKRRYRATTDSKHHLPVAENLLNRHFTPAAPNQVWTADLTYVWTDAGWLYLAGVAATPRSRASRRFGSCRTGSALSLDRTWQHERRPLEDGKQGEAHRASKIPNTCPHLVSRNRCQNDGIITDLLVVMRRFCSAYCCFRFLIFLVSLFLWMRKSGYFRAPISPLHKSLVKSPWG